MAIVQNRTTGKSKVRWPVIARVIYSSVIIIISLSTVRTPSSTSSSNMFGSSGTLLESAWQYSTDTVETQKKFERSESDYGRDSPQGNFPAGPTPPWPGTIFVACCQYI